jgi:hypothetical protein
MMSEKQPDLKVVAPAPENPAAKAKARQEQITALLTGELPADPLARRATRQFRAVTLAVKEGSQLLQQLQRKQEHLFAEMAKLLGEQTGLLTLLLGEEELQGSPAPQTETKTSDPDGQTLEDLRKATGADRVEAVSTTGEVLEVAQGGGK